METTISDIPVIQRSEIKTVRKIEASACCAPKNNDSICCDPSQSKEENGGACCAQPEDGSACCDK